MRLTFAGIKVYADNEAASVAAVQQKVGTAITTVYRRERERETERAERGREGGTATESDSEGAGVLARGASGARRGK